MQTASFASTSKAASVSTTADVPSEILGSSPDSPPKPQKRYRRTKAQMEEARSLPQPQKRQRRTKAEMDEARALKAAAEAHAATQRRYLPKSNSALTQKNKAPIESNAIEKNMKEPNAIKKKGPKKKEFKLHPADPTAHFGHLPSPELWNDSFHQGTKWNTSHRFFLRNPKTVDLVAEAMDLPGRSKAAGRKMTILEGYPGVGTMTRRFLKDPHVERVVAMENHSSFSPWLESLSSDTVLGDDALKFRYVGESSYDWTAYDNALETGMLDNIPHIRNTRQSFPKYPENIHAADEWTADSSLVYFSHMPSSVHGEQLMAQLVTAIGNRLWMFRYSRMPMYFVCSEHVAQRCTAGPGDKLRSRMSLLTQALGDAKIVLDSSHFLPHEQHFWPWKPTIGPRLPISGDHLASGKLSSGLNKQDNSLLLIEPRKQPLVSRYEMEAFDFIVRSIFVMRARTVGAALKHMAPGATNLLNVLNNGHPAAKSLGNITIEPDQPVVELSIEQIVALAKVFERWPFRPRNLFEEGRIHRGEDRLVPFV